MTIRKSIWALLVVLTVCSLALSACNITGGNSTVTPTWGGGHENSGYPDGGAHGIDDGSYPSQ